MVLAGFVDAGFVMAAPPAPTADPYASAECAEDDPTACAQPLERGDKAPFAGQLLTPPLAIKLGQEAAGCQARIDLEVSRTTSVAAVNRVYDRQICAIDMRSLDRQLIAMTQDRDFWRERNASETNPAWFVALGAVGGLVAVYLAALLVHAVP